MRDFAELFNWLGKPAGFSASAEYFESDEPPDRPLIQVLGIDADHLKPLTAEMLKSVEDNDLIKSVPKAVAARFLNFRTYCPSR